MEENWWTMLKNTNKMDILAETKEGH